MTAKRAILASVLIASLAIRSGAADAATPVAKLRNRATHAVATAKKKKKPAPLLARNAPASLYATVSVVYDADRESVIACSAGLECDVELEAGETVGPKGFGSNVAAWAFNKPVYSGTGAARIPHIIFRAPKHVGTRTNAIILTDRRTYHILLIATADPRAIYYRYAYPKVVALRTQADLVAVAPSPEPDPVSRCFDFAYTAKAAGLPQDHPTNAHASTAAMPAIWTPRFVCTDGRHTIVGFPPTIVTPDDTPVVEVLGPEGDTLLNSRYDEATRRLTLDGVPDAFVLELGSQAQPLRIAINRATHNDTPIGAGNER